MGMGLVHPRNLDFDWKGFGLVGLGKCSLESPFVDYCDYFLNGFSVTTTLLLERFDNQQFEWTTCLSVFDFQGVDALELLARTPKGCITHPIDLIKSTESNLRENLNQFAIAVFLYLYIYN